MGISWIHFHWFFNFHHKLFDRRWMWTTVLVNSLGVVPLNDLNIAKMPDQISHFCSGCTHSCCRQALHDYQPHDCLLNRLFRRRSKKTSKVSVTGLCEGNLSVTGWANNAENVSIWWRHHVSWQSHYDTISTAILHPSVRAWLTFIF